MDQLSGKIVCVFFCFLEGWWGVEMRKQGQGNGKWSMERR